MEQIAERSNLNLAFKRVKANKGASGVDGMTVDELGAHVKAHKGEILVSLLKGSYAPSPVRGVSLPKPQGGTREHTTRSGRRRPKSGTSVG